MLLSIIFAIVFAGFSLLSLQFDSSTYTPLIATLPRPNCHAAQTEANRTLQPESDSGAADSYVTQDGTQIIRIRICNVEGWFIIILDDIMES